MQEHTVDRLGSMFSVPGQSVGVYAKGVHVLAVAYEVCLRDNTTKVRNIKQYLRAMLFNAPSTINSYYASLVAHDMAQPDWGRPPNT